MALERRNEGSGLKKIYSKVSAENADDLIFRNHALFELGQLYFEKCDFPNAVDCLEKVKTEALQFHLYDNYFRSISYLLRIHAERLDFDKHASLIREVLQVGSSLTGYARYLPKLQYNQGIAAVYRNAEDEAAGYFGQAARSLQELIAGGTLQGREEEEALRDSIMVRYSLAILQKSRKEYTECLASTTKLLKEIDELNHGEKALEHIQLYDIEATILVCEGQVYRETNEHQKALDKFWAAHSLLKSHRNWSHYYYVLLGLGRVYQAMGNHERAQIFFDLISDAISNLELNELKQILEKVSKSSVDRGSRLQIDRERKVVIESKLGEVHFERRFVLLEILYLLASQPGKVFTKEELVDRIWRESYNPMIHDSKVYTSISRLRKLIEPDFRKPIYILNERDGYAFSSAVELEEVNPRTRKTAGAALSSPNKDAAARSDEPTPVKREGGASL
jgi:DNA-binding winged helix-turn-helix (wHTH) protein